MKGIIVCRLPQYGMRAYYEGCILCVWGATVRNLWNMEIKLFVFRVPQCEMKGRKW